ncbi:MAG: hypothetical protein ACYTKC_21880 [Planctomycetota bacterium]|jgi:hypothetical protein
MKYVSGLVICLLSSIASAQIAISNFSSTYSGAQTRGFFFQAPIDFEVTGAQVPDETKKGKQMVAFYKLTAAPAAYPASTPATPVFFKTGVASGQVIAISPSLKFKKGDWFGVLGACGAISPSLKFKKGDWFGVLGACGPNTGTVFNSYGAGMFKSSVLGMPVTLARFIMQKNIAAVSGVGGVSAAGTGSIARVRVYVKGHGASVNYGQGSVTATPGELAGSDPNPPSIGTTAALVVKPGSATNSGGLLGLGTKRIIIVTPAGTFLNIPHWAVLPIPGPIPTTGSKINIAIPKDNTLLGVVVTFQAAIIKGSIFTLTNGVEWTGGL